MKFKYKFPENARSAEDLDGTVLQAFRDGLFSDDDFSLHSKLPPGYLSHITAALQRSRDTAPHPDVRHLIQSAEYAEHLIGSQKGGIQPNQLDAVHTILQRITSLLENPHVESHDQGTLRDIESRLSSLEGLANQRPMY
jgi:hypothetical protein